MQDAVEVNVSLGNGAHGGIIGHNMDNKPRDGMPQERRYTISIRSLFRDFNVPREIDYLSLDVEGAEELIMESFPFDLYTIRILTVERTSSRVRSLLESNGYRWVVSLSKWGEALWVHNTTLEKIPYAKLRSICKQLKSNCTGRT
mmetsp:Transcript_25623/g.62834  ORF Transcript_25623/g.62834 Transcript_25623/m.62834 type:complete len:145 (+) Transcript_25623:614-1048(+)